MNLGHTLLTLRKQKDITQEQLAAELGVTAAAVSKWENNNTLPDILMLCAIADYFQVTTDELLGRVTQWKYAVVAAETEELGETIKNLAKSFGFATKYIFTSYADAIEAVKADRSITHLFASFEKPLSEEKKEDRPDSLCSVESQASTREQILDGFQIYFQNMTAYDAITKNRSQNT